MWALALSSSVGLRSILLFVVDRLAVAFAIDLSLYRSLLPLKRGVVGSRIAAAVVIVAVPVAALLVEFVL